MPSSRPMKISVDEQQHLMEWWNTTESAKLVVQHLVSLISELRLHSESSHADGMVLFYRAALRFHTVTRGHGDVSAGLLQVNIRNLFGKI
ncbi:hypothetical protein NDK43_11545 [Neobacillus pocheonensis]|uniref:Uncharacterized protein n=1 Tax=Neobacillus pocheonensis TaxID=363869 RepID=A0ABT0W995_9BACI|nr:hypothetical protein [Neobacillus pocheonensis]